MCQVGPSAVSVPGSLERLATVSPVTAATDSRADAWTLLACAARDAAPRGRESAMEAFVAATWSDVWRLCAHLGDRDRADDLTQETYLRVLRSLRSFRGDSPVRPWLFSIVRRVVADDIAARQRRRREPVGVVRDVPDHQGSVVLESLLEGLDPDRRLAFVLTQVLGYPYADAAEICACPVGTIRSRVARAREDLVAMLDDVRSRRLA
jgi:RNA polymerase sigma-70 factor, ECF subfamily